MALYPVTVLVLVQVLVGRTDCRFVRPPRSRRVRGLCFHARAFVPTNYSIRARRPALYWATSPVWGPVHQRNTACLWPSAYLPHRQRGPPNRVRPVAQLDPYQANLTRQEHRSVSLRRRGSLLPARCPHQTVCRCRPLAPPSRSGARWTLGARHLAIAGCPGDGKGASFRVANRLALHWRDPSGLLAHGMFVMKHSPKKFGPRRRLNHRAGRFVVESQIRRSILACDALSWDASACQLQVRIVRKMGFGNRSSGCPISSNTQ